MLSNPREPCNAGEVRHDRAARAGALTAIAAAIMVALSAALVGVKGLIGAPRRGWPSLPVFFGISVLVVGRAARVSPQAMMVAALVTYLVKIVLSRGRGLLAERHDRVSAPGHSDSSPSAASWSGALRRSSRRSRSRCCMSKPEQTAARRGG